jgi:hypothetical protein
MYESLKKCCDNFHLYILSFDERTFNILTKLSLEHVTVISLNDFEDEELLKLKPTRTKAEYCWTCTPSTIYYIIKKYNVDSCTYIDADLFFYSNPKILFEEMGEKSVMITEHRYSKSYDRSKIAGIYCVQFITFKNDRNGLAVLHWWRNACNDWCYNRYEDGKFGDQKYLDDWTTRFEGVHVLEHLGGGMAPWNIQQYKQFLKQDNKLSFITKKEINKFEIVFYHFHYVRFYQKNIIDLGWFIIPKKILNTLYAQYVKKLDDAEKTIKVIDTWFSVNIPKFKIDRNSIIKEKIKILFKLITRFNLYNKKKLLKINGI